MTDKPKIQEEPAPELKEEELDQAKGGIIAILIGRQGIKDGTSNVTDGTSNT